MTRVFVSYRRDDSAAHAGRLYDRLASEFHATNVFMDLDSIGPGEPFETRIRAAIDRTDVLIAVIGQHWLSAQDRTGTARLWSENDFVRREIALALAAGVPVIPALVGRADVPTADSLPTDIRPLVGFQAVELSDSRWSQDVGRLIEAIDRTGPRTAGWIRKARSRPATLWTVRVLTPLLSIGALLLGVRALNALGASQNVQLAWELLMVGAAGAGLSVIEKYIGRDRRST